MVAAPVVVVTQYLKRDEQMVILPILRSEWEEVVEEFKVMKAEWEEMKAEIILINPTLRFKSKE